jgi:hypothetical protein
MLLKEGRTLIQNQYFDFTSKLFNGGKPTKRYILENDALYSWKQMSMFILIYRQKNGYDHNEQQRDQTIKTARFKENMKRI